MLWLRYLLKQQVKSKSTYLQAVDVQEKRAVLYRRITKWQDVQSFYMPGVVPGGGQEVPDGEALHPEDILLHLPSGIPTSQNVPESLVDIEKRLRVAQADDALVELRRLLRITLGLWDYKFNKLGPGQRANTRTRSIIAKFQEKIKRCVTRYRVARLALAKLDLTGSWSERFPELKAEDVRGPGKREDGESEGRRELSWIWMARSDNQDVSKEAKEDEIGESKQDTFQLRYVLSDHLFRFAC
jgi:hypothetical protein